MREHTRKTRLRDFVASIGRNTYMIRDSKMQLTAGFAQIQRIAALALKFVNDARSQLHGNSIFKPKKIWQTESGNVVNIKRKVLIRESLLISKLKPSLNKNIRSFPLSLF